MTVRSHEKKRGEKQKLYTEKRRGDGNHCLPLDTREKGDGREERESLRKNKPIR